jgi:hypothetical protein
MAMALPLRLVFPLVVTLTLTATRPAAALQGRGPDQGLCGLLASRSVSVPAGDAAGLRLASAPLLHVTADEALRELVLDIGPVDVPPHAMAAHSDELVYQLAYIPFDLWTHGFRLTLTDAHGRPVPRRVLHHIDTARPAARDLFLPVAQRFVALGAETGNETLPAWLVGVRLHAGEPLLVSTMLHNPTHTGYRGVHVRLILPYTRARPLVEVAGFRVDVMFPTGPMEFDLAPGRTVRSWEGSPAVPARILGLSGHLHKYAEWIALEDVTTHRVLWRARPRLDREGNVAGVPVSFPRWGLGQVVIPSHRYRVTTSYFNPTSHVIPDGAMAKIGGVFTPLAPLPPVEVGHPLYQQDLRYILSLRCSPPAMPEMVAHAEHGGGE